MVVPSRKLLPTHVWAVEAQTPQDAMQRAHWCNPTPRSQRTLPCVPVLLVCLAATLHTPSYVAPGSLPHSPPPPPRPLTPQANTGVDPSGGPTAGSQQSALQLFQAGLSRGLAKAYRDFVRLAGAAIRHRLNKGNAHEEDDESKWPVVSLRHTLWKDAVVVAGFVGAELHASL